MLIDILYMLNKIKNNEEISMKVLTIANRKGGAGKSTCAAHFATEAISGGIKTIIIDMDPQKTLEGWWTRRQEEDLPLIDLECTLLRADRK